MKIICDLNINANWNITTNNTYNKFFICNNNIIIYNNNNKVCNNNIIKCNNNNNICNNNIIYNNNICINWNFTIKITFNLTTVEAGQRFDEFWFPYLPPDEIREYSYLW